MTAAVIQEQFKFLYNKLDSNSYKNFYPEEIDLLLNKAQMKLIKNKIQPLNYSLPSMEETSKRNIDLSNLIVNYQVAPQPPNSSNKSYNHLKGYFVELPDNFFLEANEEVELNNSCKKKMDVIAITHNKYNFARHNPFLQPDKDQVLRLPYTEINGKRNFEILVESTLVPAFYILRYYRYPLYIYEGSYTPPVIPSFLGTLVLGTPQDPEMSEEFCDELIYVAVEMALENIESPRTQTNQLVNSIN